MSAHIEYIRIKNSIGLMDGLGLTDVELRFGSNKIILFLGGNGQGKSSLMAQLNPLFDKSLFISGVIGEKEIHYRDPETNTRFIINHRVTPAGKVSSKMDKVLPDNTMTSVADTGGVNLFNEAVFTELGFTKEFFNIGYVGSDISGFVDSIASERKKFISKFISVIDPYLAIYKNAAKDHQSLQKQVKSLQNDLDIIENIEDTQKQADELTERLNVANNELNKVKINFNTASAMIKSILDELRLTEAADFDGLGSRLQEEMAQFSTQLSNHCVQLESFSREISDHSLTLEFHQSSLPSVMELVTSSQSALAVIKEKLRHLDEELEQKTAEFTQLTKTVINSNSGIINQLSEIDEKIVQIETDSMSHAYTLNLNGTKPTSITDLTDITNEEKRISAALSPRSINTILGLPVLFAGNVSIYNILSDSIKEFVSSGGTALGKLCDAEKQQIIELEREVTEFKNQLRTKESEVKILELLKQRPVECTIDHCTFIKDAVAKKHLPEEIDSIKIQVNDHSTIIDSIRSSLDTHTRMHGLLSTINDGMKTISTKLREFKELFSFYPVPTIFDEIINSEFSSVILDFTAYVNLVKQLADIDTSKYNTLTELMASYNTAIQTKSKLQSQSEALIIAKDRVAQLEQRIEEIKLERVPVFDNFKELSLAAMNAETEKSNITSLITQYADKIKRIRIQSDLLTKDNNAIELKILDNENRLNRFNALQKQFNEQTTIAAEAKAQYQAQRSIPVEIKADLDKVTETLSRYKFLVNRINTLENQFNASKQLLEAVHPTSGVQLLFINQYMNKPKKITNELLNLAHGGNFQIDFKIDNAGFRIPVYKNGKPSSDILDISSGQRAIVKTALSMSLVAAFIGKYRILNLDELDPFLDSKHRFFFLDILRNQIKKLDIAQVFIISHNDQFYSCDEPLDLILFPEHNAPVDNPDFMARNNVVKDFTK